MRLEKWWPWYEKILQTFGFDRAADQRATDLLSDLLVGRSLQLRELRRLVEGQRIIVLGAGPSLERNLRSLAKRGSDLGYRLMAADGATTAVLKLLRRAPDIVVTDLDGRFEDILSASQAGAVVVVHAHGDNVPSLKACVPRFDARVVGTTQAEPRPRVYNFGGFTDGDRCVFLAEAFSASRVVLAGMDLGVYIGRYSKPRLRRAARANRTKRLKLEVARGLLEWVATWARADLVNVTGRGKGIKGIRNSTIEEL